MSEMCLVSIVVPVYNVEKYLKRCLDSLLVQTYNNIEIIIIDDGSTDSSREICDEYKQKDPRINVVHKENGGLADARNVGIDCSKGDYIFFVDSDDWVSKNCIEVLINEMINNSVEIVVGRHNERKIFKDYEKTEIKSVKFLDKEKALEAYLYQRISSSAWAKLYKRDLFKDIRYPKGKLYEDVVVTFLLLEKTNRIAIVDAPIYSYFVRSGSIINSSFSIKKMDYYYATKELLNIARIRYPEFVNAAISRMLWAEVHLVVKMDSDREKYVKENEIIWNDIISFRRLVIFKSSARLVNKVVLLISLLGQKALCYVYKKIT